MVAIDDPNCGKF